MIVNYDMGVRRAQRRSTGHKYWLEHVYVEEIVYISLGHQFIVHNIVIRNLLLCWGFVHPLYYVKVYLKIQFYQKLTIYYVCKYEAYTNVGLA